MMNSGSHGTYNIWCISCQRIKLVAIIPHTHGSLLQIDKLVETGLSNFSWKIVGKEGLKEVFPLCLWSTRSSRSLPCLIPKEATSSS
ncbi:hypothetical protein RDI58_014925 [Solanum bulbocastanum]|uniref:Uncharacterized protein n=1 Tax=Solanum bulbocastanum TaxID=147425 RepID=A0AAN8YB12_SOLBU